MKNFTLFTLGILVILAHIFASCKKEEEFFFPKDNQDFPSQIYPVEYTYSSIYSNELASILNNYIQYSISEEVNFLYTIRSINSKLVLLKIDILDYNDLSHAKTAKKVGPFDSISAAGEWITKNSELHSGATVVWTDKDGVIVDIYVVYHPK